jgi:hypothetical protein
MKEKIIVIRKWKEPSVRTFMDAESVGIEMSVDDYLINMVDQITNLPFTFSKAALLVKMQEAHKNIVTDMKNTTRLL